MAIKKFKSFQEAALAGFPIHLGDDEYAEGGEIIDRSRYHALAAELGSDLANDGTFILHDLRSQKPRRD